MFTEKEVAYMKGQPLARLATVGDEEQPDVVAVTARYDGTHFLIGGMSNATTRKYKNISAGRSHVALLFDDLETIDPWRPRGIRIYGTAETVELEGPRGPSPVIRITPTISWSWSINGPAMVNGKFAPHRTVHGEETAQR